MIRQKHGLHSKFLFVIGWQLVWAWMFYLFTKVCDIWHMGASFVIYNHEPPMTLTCLQGRIVQIYTITWVSIICFQYCYPWRTHIWTFWMTSIIRKKLIHWVSDGHFFNYNMDQVTFRSSELLSSLCVRRHISSVHFHILIFFSESIWTTRTKLGRNV